MRGFIKTIVNLSLGFIVNPIPIIVQMHAYKNIMWSLFFSDDNPQQNLKIRMDQ